MDKSPVPINNRKHYEDTGYTIVDRVFAKAEIQKMKENIEEIWIEKIVNKELRQNISRPTESLFPPLRNPHLYNSNFKNIVLDPRVFEIAQELLQEDVLIVGSTVFFKAPQTNRLPLHQDNYDIGAYPGTSCAVWISLDQTDEKNGGLIMVPKTHTVGFFKPRKPGHKSLYGQEIPVPEGYEVVDVSTDEGDVVAFSGNILHGSHANVTKNRFRRAIVVHFVGISTQKIYVQSNKLLNKDGEYVSISINKNHSLVRLFIDK